MRPILLLLFVLAFAKTSHCQSTPQAVIEALFDAMRVADSATIKQLMHPQASLSTLASLPGGSEVKQGSTRRFIQSIGQMEHGMADEQIGRMDVRIDGDLAQVWVPYSFYLNGEFSHCGTNAFTLVKNSAAQWQLLYLIDTRRKSACTTALDSATVAMLDRLMDEWHHAATVADEDTYFGAMSEDCIFLGTDETERWLRDTMATKYAYIFERDTAWAFFPKARDWYLSDDGQTAWFEEHLDSWMGVVRGSGVLTRQAESTQWKIRHYNLALAVPNEKMDDVRVAIDPTAKRREKKRQKD